MGAIVAARGQSEADRVVILLDRCESMGVNVSLLTLDRGFYNTGVISLLNTRSIRFLMSATRCKHIKRAVAQFVAGVRA